MTPPDGPPDGSPDDTVDDTSDGSPDGTSGDSPDSFLDDVPTTGPADAPDDPVGETPATAGGVTPPGGRSAEEGRLDALEPSLRAVAAAVAALAASYALAGTSPSFVAAPVAAIVVAATPDVVIQYSITLLGDAGKLLGLATALVLTVALLAAAARLGPRFASDRPGMDALLSGLVVATVAAAITRAPAPSLAAGAAAAVVVAAPYVLSSRRHETTGRRKVLAAVGTALGTGVLGVAVGARGGGSSEPAGVDPDADGPEGEVGQKLSMAGDRSLDVKGLEGLVSSSFYTVDIAQFDPKVSTGEWELSVTGAVESEQTYDFADIQEREWDHRFETLRCVGENLNGHKCDNALWTGIPIWDLVEPADPQGEYVMLRAEDDYFEEFPLEAMQDGMLAVAMNGAPLPREHGAPARALIPGHWGEINVKWINEIEVLDRPAKGYWEKRGWHGTGPVNTVAKLWVVNHLNDGRVEVAGHAYAGTRGVSNVEVSTDGGDTWTDAELSEPLPGDDVWRQWAHRYDPPDGAHEVVVRAVDADGRVQPEERNGSFPSGPTGWVTKTVRP
jgi:hypothetical protein